MHFQVLNYYVLTITYYSANGLKSWRSSVLLPPGSDFKHKSLSKSACIIIDQDPDHSLKFLSDLPVPCGLTVLTELCNR